MTLLIKYSDFSPAVPLNGQKPLAPRGAVACPSLESIRDRLRMEVPQGVYLSEEAVAELLGFSKKSLQNLRARKPENFAEVHPPYVELPGRRGVRFPRGLLIDFLADLEFKSLTRHIHRCR